jgi:MoxR-like ATPase
MAKLSFVDILNKFVQQSRGSSLETKSYPKEYNDFTLKISFGQGNAANIPWIAFLPAERGMTVSNGYYPCYLYFKNEGTLILAYGVSETERPKLNWPKALLDTRNKIGDSNLIRHPSRYEDSYIYKSYRVDNSDNKLVLFDSENVIVGEDVIESDLETLLKQYGESLESNKTESSDEELLYNKSFSLTDISVKLRKILYFDNSFNVSWIVSAIQSSNVLMYGPPGTGKTEIAKYMSNSLGDMHPMILTSNALWFRRDVIGGETIKNSSVEWKSGFIPKAYNQLSERYRNGNQNLHFIILDELNRADADKAFGDFFTIFSSPDPSKWSISKDLIEEIKSYGTNIDSAGKNFLENYGTKGDTILSRLRIIATMNVTDVRNLFLVGEALLRRFTLCALKGPKDGSDVEFISKKLMYNNAINIKNLKDIVEKLRLQNEKKIKDYYLSQAAVERTIMLLKNSPDEEVSKSDIVELLKMSAGTMDDRVLEAFDSHKA